MKGTLHAAAAIMCAALVLCIPFHPLASAQDPPDDEEISNPALIPLMDDYHTPQIEPGDDGELTFRLTNRYRFNLTRLELELEIYKFANLDTSEALEHLDEVPTFRSGDAEGITAETNRSGIHFTFATGLVSKASYSVSIHIHASMFSELGTYLVRSSILFEAENGTYWMRSRGYFPDPAWYEYEKHKNLTKLGSDSGLGSLHGIIPDTSFGVKKSTDYTYFYVLVVLIAVFGILALLFYLMDEKGKFPRAKEKLDHTWDRLRGMDRSK